MQNQVKRSSQHVYDYVIIGSGLSGLAIAAALNKETSNILLVDSADTFGGHNRSLMTPFGPVNNGIRTMPSTELSHKAIAFLEMLMMTNVQPQEIDCPPVTFDSGALKPFVGFGENPPAFYDELSYFFSPKQLKFHIEPHEWTQLLFNHYSGDFSPRSYVTKFHGADGVIKSTTINGQKQINALNFIYCGPVKSLHLLLPEDGLSYRARQKMSKSEYWTAVCLDILHQGKVTDSEAVHVLNGTTQDEIGPCAGKFLPSVEVNDQALQYSQWISFVNDEDAEDTENVGHLLKKMKRQIKRAYPNALDNIKSERILVVPSFGGNGDIKLSANQSLPAYPNLWVGSSQMHTQKNLLGALLQAEMITSALGCNPLGVQVDTGQMASESESETQA
ncbi:MAG: hypothetical protein BroJett040_10410 [Oligoflexia bacterium]|nr:MAG: hypothetical protein BroJett040_10410 [Oligoflexia bacterium]